MLITTNNAPSKRKRKSGQEPVYNNLTYIGKAVTKQVAIEYCKALASQGYAVSNVVIAKPSPLLDSKGNNVVPEALRDIEGVQDGGTEIWLRMSDILNDLVEGKVKLVAISNK